MTKENADYLLSIKSVRETNLSTRDLLLTNKLSNFDVDLSKLPNIIKFVCETIRSSFPTEDSFQKIPVHGRYQHFEVGGKTRLTNLIEHWKEVLGLSDYEICKKIIDLFVISVLLDAGAGNDWSYKEDDGTVSNRSEGIAIATFHMFSRGVFSDSSDSSDPYQVNGSKLAAFSTESLTMGFQISESNPIAGFEGRLNLLQKLGKTLSSNKEMFGIDGRPGNLIDYLMKLPTTTKLNDDQYEIDLVDLWTALMNGLNPIWPDDDRLKFEGKSLGDTWILQSKINESLQKYPEYKTAEELPINLKVVTFHKLTQWLTYSLFLPLSKFGHFKIKNEEYMTGLPEYRNGGLFVDFGLLTLKSDVLKRGIQFQQEINGNDKEHYLPAYLPKDDVIVEWRSCTIVLLDYILPLVNKELQIKNPNNRLSLPQLIEAGSWKSGRLIAAKLRPTTKGAPIELISDGTVF
ncbi:hypothetical protein PACTADRAFT_49387 [Pachysolen tannophilus NRRL Y-2460]|uniref:Uracil catabolism protein 4 n=1 Tax=Pachysolen tannophilus NRRL Y-2460 TaxID=669874 RepID=A0A1E4TW44_PACTA|nr:hypothetical protein PACTADRAFT_49387 [Pachysolen tannophilus NRRL Y-2460]